jgi:hypothetical protein
MYSLVSGLKPAAPGLGQTRFSLYTTIVVVYQKLVSCCLWERLWLMKTSLFCLRCVDHPFFIFVYVWCVRVIQYRNKGK